MNQFLIYLNPVIIFLPWNVVKEKLTLAGRGGGGISENVAVGVRAAVRLQSNTGGQRFFKCSSQTKCETKRC